MMLYLRVVPGFGIAAEVARRPEIRSRPIVLGGLPHQRGMVREASFLAQRSGVHAGMALSQAHQHCPGAIFLTPDLPYYEAVWVEICALLYRFTPLVEPIEPGQAICDLSGCERHWEDVADTARSLAGDIRRFGIVPWLGVASSWITAQLASTVVGEDGITIVDCGQERAFLAELPLSVLPGVDPRLALSFQVLGLRTLGQLADVPASAVRQRFGAAGEQLHAWARGIDSRRVVPPPPKPAVIAGRACDEGTVEEAAELLHSLAGECAGELARRQLAGRLVTLKLWWAGESQTSYQLSALSSQPDARHNGSQGRQGSARATNNDTQRIPGTTNNASLQNKPNSSPSPDIAETAIRCSLPIPYRIHSMLPQPGNRQLASRKLKTQDSNIPTQRVPRKTQDSLRTTNSGVFDALSATVRTPIDSAAPLEERARQLLLQLWPRAQRATKHEQRTTNNEPRTTIPLQALSLEVSEFEPPRQLAFSEIDRLDQSGRLRGMDPIRLQTLLRQEELLATRYGDPTFRHVTHVDPASILTERRFRWSTGLFVEAPRRHRTAPSRRRR